LDSLDNYKMLSERMNVLTIYLPWGKLPVASNLRIVKTAVPGTFGTTRQQQYNMKYKHSGKQGTSWGT